MPQTFEFIKKLANCLISESVFLMSESAFLMPESTFLISEHAFMKSESVFSDLRKCVFSSGPEFPAGGERWTAPYMMLSQVKRSSADVFKRELLLKAFEVSNNRARLVTNSLPNHHLTAALSETVTQTHTLSRCRHPVGRCRTSIFSLR